MKSFFEKNKFLLKIMLLTGCAGTTVGISNITITLFAVQLGASSSQIGFIQGVQSIGLLLTVLPMGFLVDHYGAKKLFIIGSMTGAIIFFLFQYAKTPVYLMAGTFILGFFMSFRYVSISSIFLEHLKTVGNNKAGWFRAAHSIGMAFIGPLLGAYLVRHAGYQLTFVSISSILIFVVVLASLVLINKHNENIVPDFSFISSFNYFKSLLSNKEIFESSITEALSLATFSCFNTFIVVIAIRNFHLVQEAAALFISLQGIIYILALFSFGRVLAKIGQKNFYISGILSVITGLLFLSSANNPVWIWPGTVFIGLGLGALNLINVTRLGNLSGKKGKISGVFSLFSVAGSISGPILGGIIGSLFNLQTIYLILIPLFILLLIRVYYKTDVKISKVVLNEFVEKS